MNEPRTNIYICEYGCRTVTVDVANGVTPYAMKCRSKPRPDRPISPECLGSDGECIGLARSSFYPRGSKPPHIGEATHEWYAPSAEEIAAFKDMESVEHAMKGGLFLRSRTSAEPMYHAAGVAGE